ncbi:MAG: hypothetical protein AAF748_10045 [Pseudomonadota bacterium]
MVRVLILLAAFGLSAPALAQDPNADPRSAALNLGLAAKLCMTGSRVPDTLPQIFGEAGFDISPGLGEMEFEVRAHGIFGAFDIGSGYCFIQTAVVPLETTQPMIRDLANTLYPGQVQEGAPEGGTGPCDGLSIFAPRRLIWVSYAAAGNSGECLFDGTSSVIIQ